MNEKTNFEIIVPSLLKTDNTSSAAVCCVSGYLKKLKVVLRKGTLGEELKTKNFQKTYNILWVL